MKLFAKGTALTISALLLAVCLAACGGGGGNTPEPAGGGGENPEPAGGTPSVATQTYSVTDEEEGTVLTLEVPQIDGMEVSEMGDRSGYRIKYPEGGWQLDIWSETYNAEALAKKISEGESVTYGSNTGSLEFSSWAAQGNFDFGPVPDSALALTARYDIRPADTYQPDDEAELRGYLADENVGMIFSAMKVELSK